MLGFLKDLARFFFNFKSGGRTEVTTAMLARMHLGQEYRIFDNVTLPTPDGTTQIDLLILSSHGVFVIEIKDYSGWIFG